MIFSSFHFIFFFLPLIILIFLKANTVQIKILILVLGSFIFYGYHSLHDLILMISSILFNYIAGKNIFKNKKVLIFSLIVNIIGIGYFKYKNFILEIFNFPFVFDNYTTEQKLPLGISFFTFQQIAYLVDAYYGKIIEKNILKYSLLVSFFPHSIAGPLVQYKELAPQFNNIKISNKSLILGGAIFIVGLLKKVVFADSLAPCANAVFDSVSVKQIIPSFTEAWYASICYTLQLYFDFSGYSDMAIGLAKIFNIGFPINFNSPYKATSIIDFWRRWHITLSLFLKNYIYIPLGGNRCSLFAKYKNIFITMLIGGLWHGANWTFVLWGGFHGLCLIINHQYNMIYGKHDFLVFNQKISLLLKWFLTIFVVIIGWVLFRAENIKSAIVMYKSMFLFHGLSLSPSLQDYIFKLPFVSFDGFFKNNLFYFMDYSYLIIAGIIICCFLSNTKRFFDFSETGFKAYREKEIFQRNGILWGQNILFAVLFGFLSFIILLFMLLNKKSEFLYFNF